MRLCRAAWVTGAALALLGCRDPTQITVDVHTDAVCSDVGTTTITVGRLGAIETKAPTSSVQFCQSGFIGTLVITPSGGNTDEVAFKVVTGIRQSAEQCTAPAYMGCIVARRSLQFIPHTPLVVEVPLDLACENVPCGATDTCVNGNCVPAQVMDPQQCASPGGCGPPDAGPPPDASADGAVMDSSAPDGADASQDAADASSDTGDDVSADASDAGDSGCGDTSTDMHNCGSCGHDCLGGSCVGGACQPVVMTSGESFPRGIAVDATNVYWVDAKLSGTVMQQAIAGGMPTTLASAQHQPWLVAVGSGFVFWTNYGNNESVNKVPIGGGTVTALATGQGNPAGIAVDANNVYWSDAINNSTVWQVAIAGGTPTALTAATHSNPWAVTVDGARVYWIDYGNGSSAYSVPIGGGAESTIGTTGLSPYTIATYGSNVYFTAWTSVNNGTVLSAPSAGGGPTTMLASGLDVPSGLAVDASGIYVTENGAGNLDFVPFGGGTVKVLVSGLSGPRGVTTDATSIYWTNDGGNVMRLAK